MYGFTINKSQEGFQYIQFPALSALEGIRHLFTTKVGGRSKGVYAEANFSYTRGDEKEAVDANYALAAQALSAQDPAMKSLSARESTERVHDSQESMVGAVPLQENTTQISSVSENLIKSDKQRIGKGFIPALDDFVLTWQTHTDCVRHVTKEDGGKGVTKERTYTDVDALITDTPGIVLTTLHADCTPLYFVDTKHRAIGLAHSGWRGTAKGIGEKTILAMGEAFHTNPQDLICVIGPVICETHYEVSQDVFDAFMERYGADCEKFRLFTKSPILEGKYFFSLERANEMVLRLAGVPEGQIHASHLCTYCEADMFYSHRRDGEKRGNMAAMLMLD